MEFLQGYLENSEYAFLSAFLLGLMTAISPCPLATNITAIGYISRDLTDRKRVFYNGLIYTLGRAISYSSIGLILFFGASKFSISRLFQGWGEKILGPLLILIGLFMLDFIRISIPGLSAITSRMENRSSWGYWNVLLLGILFALAFCPYSGVLYFVMLIPLTLSAEGGLFLPGIFAIATGIPVILLAWILAFALGNMGNVYNQIKTFEKWFRRVVAIVFILVGFYYIYIFFIN